MEEEKKNDTYKAGDIITFGTYGGEKISWRVLDVLEDKAFLVTNLLIYYDNYDVYVNNYDGSYIRKWLNNEFYNTFTQEEKERIQLTLVDNSLATTE